MNARPGAGNVGNVKGLPAPTSPTPTPALPPSPVSPSAPPGALRPSPGLGVSLSQPPDALRAALAGLRAPASRLQPPRGGTEEREAAAGADAGRRSRLTTSPGRAESTGGTEGGGNSGRFRAPPPLLREIVSRFEFGARRLVGITCRAGPMRCGRGRGASGQSAAAAGDTDVPVGR